MKKLGIFGGGFVSYNVCKLLKDEFDITLYARRPFEDLNTKFVKVEDFCNWEEVSKISVAKKSNFLLCASRGGSRIHEDYIGDYYNNIQTYVNVYKRLITINASGMFFIVGSGAEYDENRHDYYTDSKRVINNLYGHDECSNLTYAKLNIWGSFGERQLNTRFIETCFRQCKKGEPVYIDKDCFFDFISMYDFATIIKHCIKIKWSFVDCVYKEKYTLSEIAKIINNFYGNKSEIIVKSLGEEKDNYIHDSKMELSHLGMNLLGLEESLIKIKDEYYDRNGESPKTL